MLDIANRPYLGWFLRSTLPGVAPYCVPGGVRVVSIFPSSPVPRLALKCHSLLALRASLLPLDCCASRAIGLWRVATVHLYGAGKPIRGVLSTRLPVLRRAFGVALRRKRNRSVEHVAMMRTALLDVALMMVLWGWRSGPGMRYHLEERVGSAPLLALRLAHHQLVEDPKGSAALAGWEVRNVPAYLTLLASTVRFLSPMTRGVWYG